ncbi:7TM chemoreceptor [Necator americanus]|uniref:7TM chemoreceptor n=1 Tax=Necator americanus TaxID=51031 RepID=W2SJ84_NECAM|nr:7TM chemoreceptor [Necator americanus]ETN69660.1 7TM chemoreceptor [Necator americanus]
MATSISDMLSTSTYVICSFALFNNAILLILFFRCPLKNVHSYRYYFIISIIQDVIYSVSLILAVPRVVSQSNFFIFISTGWLDQEPFGYIPLIVFCLSLNTSLLIVTDGFVYKYFQVRKLNQFQHQTSRRTIAIAVLINLAVIINYVVTVYVVMWPEDHFTCLVENTIKLHDLDITTVTFIGLSMKYGMNALNIALMLDMIAVMVLMECIHFFCAKSINNLLKKSTKSRKSQSIHRQMLILLVVQAACPAICLHIPCAASTFFLFTGISTTSTITNTIGVLLALYPFLNPLIIIVFVKDYRNFVLNILRIGAVRRQAGSSVARNNPFVSDVHVVANHLQQRTQHINDTCADTVL